MKKREVGGYSKSEKRELEKEGGDGKGRGNGSGYLQVLVGFLCLCDGPLGAEFVIPRIGQVLGSCLQG